MKNLGSAINDLNTSRKKAVHGFLIITIVIKLANDTESGISVFDFGAMLLSLVIFGFTKQFPELTIELCCKKAFDKDDIWVFHRIRNAILSLTAGAVSWAVNFEDINVIVSVLCYCGALLCTLVLAFFTLENMNEIARTLRILKSIKEDDISKIRRQNTDSNARNSNSSKPTIANRMASIHAKYSK